MVAGAGGGLQGPSGIYTTLSRKLQKSGVLALRLDYRRPNQLSMCVDDVHDAIRELNTQYGVERVVLVGMLRSPAHSLLQLIIKLEAGLLEVRL